LHCQECVGVLIQAGLHRVSDHQPPRLAATVDRSWWAIGIDDVLDAPTAQLIHHKHSHWQLP